MTSAEYTDDFSARLSLALQACNLSRAQLSSLLGVHKSMVSRWLSGEMKPTGYNLARISTALAKAKPGFNMTLWTAPRAEFEAALGLPSARPLPVADLEAVAAVSWRAAAPKRNGASLSSAKLVGARSVYIPAAAAILLVFAMGVWLWWRNASVPLPATHLATAPSPESVAVMPFVNMSGDPTKEYLGDGMAEEILNDLANTSDLRVAARTSSFAFKVKHSDIRDIAKKLNVRTILEGSVRQQGDRVRIVAQLIDAQSGFHIWSARYDRSINDVLAVQDEIAQNIARVLGQKLAPRSGRTIDPMAYQDYLEAQYFFKQRLPSSLRRADGLAQQAIRRQPDFAAAYALRGHILLMLAGPNFALRASAARMTANALRLDPEDQEARANHLAGALMAWDWKTAEEDARRVRAMQKQTAVTINALGNFYFDMGFPEEWLKVTREGVQIDPLSQPERFNFASALAITGHLQEAIAAARVGLEIAPNHPVVLDQLCALELLAGKIAEAREFAAELHAQPGPRFGSNCDVELLFHTNGIRGLHSSVENLVSQTVGLHATDAAVLYARAGDITRAAELLANAYADRDLHLIQLRYNSRAPEALLHNPRWLAIWKQPLLRDWQRYHDRIAAELIARSGR